MRCLNGFYFPESLTKHNKTQPDHPSGLPTGINKKVLGKMKDEAGDKIITEFVGLRAKLYSYKVYEDHLSIRSVKE